MKYIRLSKSSGTDSQTQTFQMRQSSHGHQHDMSLCNKIEIHYTNINKRTREQSKNIYPVTDKHVKDNNLVFTWLPSCNATKYPGSLNFIIRFECIEDDGSISYMWHTDIFKNVTVSDVISNTESVIEDYYDILEQWKDDIINEIPQADYEQNDSSAKDYIKNKPAIATNNDTMDFLAEMGMITPITNSNGEILISSTNEIYSL